MADTYQYITNTGVIVPDTSTLLADVQQDYKDALNKQDLIMTSDTPQGVLAVSDTIVRTETANNNAAQANQINPNVAGGTALDAIMALTGMQRTAQTQTLVQNVTLTGQAGTVISAGTIAATSAQDKFQTLSTVTLNASGNATVDFASAEYGPIPCNANALTTVVTNVLGWETVNNATAGILGTTTQSDAGARALRNNTLAFQAVSLVEAITSALYAVSGVTSLTFRENTAATTQVIDGISMVAHSIYACVRGGSDLDVAAALLENKSSGAAWNGGTSVSILEPASGQSYAVTFDRPAEIPVLIKVTTPNGSADAIKQSVLDYAAGNITGMAGFVTGADVSPFEIAGAIISELVGTIVNKVEVSLTSVVSYSTSVLPIALNQIATVTLSQITVVIAP